MDSPQILLRVIERLLIDSAIRIYKILTFDLHFLKIEEV